MSRKAILNSTAIVMLMAFSLAGCSQVKSAFSTQATPNASKGTVESDAIKTAKEGVALIEAGDFKGASAKFNTALKWDITNSSIQLLNGLAYHLRAL